MKTPTRAFPGKNIVLLALAALLTLGTLACGDESIRGGEDPAWSASPSSISFPQVNLNDTASRTVTIENVGSGTLTLSNIEIVAAGGLSAAAFSTGDDWQTEASLEENESIDLTVIYSPTDTQQYRGEIRMGTNQPGLDTAIVPITTQDASPELFTARNIDFPRTPAGTSEWQMVEIENLGAAPLHISDISVNAGSRFDFSFPGDLIDGEFPPAADDTSDFPGTLNPGDEVLMRVWFNPDSDDPATGELTIASNDPTDPEFTVNLSGNSGTACLDVSHRDGLDFHLATIGQASYRTVTMTNCAPGTDLDITNLEITDDGGGVFAIRPNSYPGELPDETLVLRPQESANVVISYSPTDEVNDQGELTISSTDGADPNLRIPITGEGTTAVCPIAVAQGRAEGATQWQNDIAVTPLETVDLRGTESTDPDGGSLTYEWSVVNRPSGSNSQVSPSATSAEPNFWVDVAGVFEIELTVFDEIGMQSCESSSIIINSLPSEDIHVQLVWNSPNVPDPVTGHGTDLDLHYLHQNGNWADDLWAVFWQVRSRTWDGGLVTLDIDSRYGETPENVNHTDPADGVNYHVGVHYYTDFGNGASDATIRVYFGQELVYENRNRRITNVNDLWRVGVIQWSVNPVFHELNNITTEHNIPSG